MSECAKVLILHLVGGEAVSSVGPGGPGKGAVGDESRAEGPKWHAGPVCLSFLGSGGLGTGALVRGGFPSCEARLSADRERPLPEERKVGPSMSSPRWTEHPKWHMEKLKPNRH